MKDGKGTKVSRRHFLKLSGVTAAAGVLTGGLAGLTTGPRRSFSWSRTSRRPSPSPTGSTCSGGGRIVFHGTPEELEARADIKKERMGV